MIAYCIGLIGVWVLQDSLASIWFYPAEKLFWSHFVRIIRAILGLVLIGIGVILIIGGEN